MSQVIWTNHLKDRARQRGISLQMIDQCVRFPDRVIKSTTTNSQKHIKTIGRHQLVAAVKRQGSDWIVTSVWRKPIFFSTNRSPSLLERLESFLRRRFNP
ncbi:DUF4258 domain-containing protein [Candidatus Collierbacteria bacterium]|nr:DUF4258 domain-containing protein [Candidatus Collierbacteria bacterium]